MLPGVLRRLTSHLPGTAPHSSHLPGQRVWLVGASSGIGEALALELSRRGALVGLTARSADALHSVAERCLTRTCVAPADVTEPESLRDAAEQVRHELGGIDVMVYCTGYWESTQIESWSAEHFSRHLDVNLRGLGLALELVLPTMIVQRRGHIVGVASVAGMRGLAGGEAYGATKAAQIHLLEGLRASLRRYDVDVTTVCPGFVRTPMTSVNDFPMPLIMEPDDAARVIANAIARRRAVSTFPAPYAVGFTLAKTVPSAWWARLVAPRR